MGSVCPELFPRPPLPGMPRDCERWPQSGEKPSAAVSAGKPACRGEPWDAPWPLSSAERCPWPWRWGTAPACLPELPRPWKLPQEPSSPRPRTRPAASSLLGQVRKRRFPSTPGAGAGVLRGALEAEPQGAPRAVRGQGCPGVLRCEGQRSTEERLAPCLLRAGAGGGEGPEEEGLKQRCERGAWAWRQEGHGGGVGWGGHRMWEPGVAGALHLPALQAPTRPRYQLCLSWSRHGFPLGKTLCPGQGGRL